MKIEISLEEFKDLIPIFNLGLECSGSQLSDENLETAICETENHNRPLNMGFLSNSIQTLAQILREQNTE